MTTLRILSISTVTHRAYIFTHPDSKRSLDAFVRKPRLDTADEIGVVNMIIKRLVTAAKLIESDFSTIGILKVHHWLLLRKKDALEYKPVNSLTE